MKGRIRERLTFANVVSGIALFVALGGTSAYAANTVFSSDIVDGQVKTPDLAGSAVTDSKLAGASVLTNKLKNGAVTTDKVLNGTLLGDDVKDNALKGADVDEGTLAGALIPGIATSDLVKSSGVVRVDDPVGGGATAKPLLTVGPYTVTGFCTDQNDGFNDDVAEAYIGSSAGDWAMTSTAAGGAGSGIFLGNTDSARLSQVFGVDGVDITAGDYTAVASNRFLAGEVLTGLNLIGADCVFGATGIG